MDKHSNTRSAGEFPLKRVSAQLRALGVRPDESAESRLVALSQRIERQVKKCQALSERVLARLDEVEAEYPPLPRLTSGSDKTSNSKANRESAPHASLSRVLELFKRRDFARDGKSGVRERQGAKTSKKADDVSRLVGDIVAALDGAHKSEMQVWVETCEAIDAREGVPELLSREQAEWDKLDDLIRKSEKMPVVGLKSLQAKLRIINASTNAHSELSLGDMIDEVLTRDLLGQLEEPKKGHDDGMN